MEGMGITLFWKNKRVLITGHTGFKGSWISLWLQQLGAEVIGYSLEPPTSPSMFDLAGIGDGMTSIIGDIRDYKNLEKIVNKYRPEIILHMAAQALVRRSYQDPTGTIEANVMGTVNILNTARAVDTVRVVTVVTSDKCYENQEWVWGYRETDPMGGHDPYSASKGCAEIVTAAFRDSYFDPKKFKEHGVAIASVRAGNVIGGGDWAEDRLIPDIVRSIVDGKPVFIRYPHAIRPWQHVLDPLNGYMRLMEKLWEDGELYGGAWNFGPSNDYIMPVGQLTERIVELWGAGASWEKDEGNHPHEANYLKLDCSKARSELSWKPKLDLIKTVDWTVDWYKGHFDKKDARSLTLEQINEFERIQAR
jgi:CDP-glucose 4,6-dehydratase